ncbi:recombinase family protein [Shinella sp. S4-D37]|uniref:recombinase family protein n=1 Tax=Shinella sp. S4-D37 TaxID=3161999 RepID=UPI003465A961
MQIKPKAYSYIRISSAGQIAGDGLNRQIRAAREYADTHDLELDETLQDVGSGYHGKHVKFGALGGFLELVKRGDVDKGSFLIVESLDRLSREAVIDAQLQLLNLLKAGITVVTLIDGAVYSEDKDFTQLIISLTIMSRAHEESATKSFRAKERIRKRKEDALAGNAIYNKNIAGWIDQIRIGDSSEWRYEINQHGPTIQRIFDLIEMGIGTHKIARIMNQEKRPVLRRGINPKEQWRDAAIARIIKDETCIGTLTLFEEIDGKRVVMGEPIKNYYPAVISEEQFWRVQRNRPTHPNSGRKGERFSNLFARNTACSACGNVLKMYYGGRKHNRHSYYGCMQQRTHGATCEAGAKMFRYNALENAILDHVAEFQSDAIFGSNAATLSSSELSLMIAKAEAKITDLEQRRENLLDLAEITNDRDERIRIKDRTIGLRRGIEDEKAQLSDLIKRQSSLAEQQAALHDVSSRIAMERATWPSGSDAEVYESRARVSNSLRKFISRIVVNFSQQIAFVYVGGYTRIYMFDREGTLITTVNGAAMPFSEIEKVMRADGASEAEIAQAKDVHTKLQAAA